MTSKSKAALLASALLVMPGMALAQTEVSDQANAVAETAEQLQQEANTLGNVVGEDAAADEGDAAAGTGDEGRGDERGDGDGDSGKWGLLGLLGLAGLLGLKRPDRDRDRDRDRDLRDRRDSPGSTGTRTGTGTGTDPRL